MSARRLPLAHVRTLLAALAVAAATLVAAAAALAAPTAPPAAARDLALTFFSNTLTRAEVVSVVGRGVQDFRIDEGKVLAIRPNAIDLLERDGTRQTIRIGPGTQFPGIGRLFGQQIVRGSRVVTVRQGDGPATQVRPSGTAKAIGKLLFGPGFARAEVLTYSGKTLHDFRIDEGRIVGYHQGVVTLLERDGTRQAIAVGATTQVTVAGQSADLTAITRGLNALAVREGDGPAQELRLMPVGLVGRR